TIVMAVDGQITTLSNAINDVPTAEAAQFLFNGLYQYDVNLTPIADLTTDLCATSADGITWTCPLRDDVKFHDGSSMTADDVVYEYQLAKSDNCRFAASVCLSTFLAKVVASDPHTVVFTLKQPYAPFATSILPSISIEPKAMIEKAYSDFAGAASAVDAKAATAAKKAIDDASTANAAKPAPAPCEAALKPAEDLLTKAKITLPKRDDFNTGGANGDQFDPCAYGDALSGLLGQLVDSLSSKGVDAVAAVYPLLSFNSQPVGTGPWMCKPGCLKPGESLTLTAFKDYFNGPPATETISEPIITDDVAAANAIKAGDVNWKYSTTADAYAALKGDPNLKFASYPDFGYFALEYNLRPGQLFADLGARKAVQYCIDKAETVRVATNGNGVATEGDIPPASWAFNPDIKGVARDTKKGMDSLRSAGWTVTDANGDGKADGPATKAGKPFSTQVYVRAGKTDRIKFMELLRDQVIDCGIKIEVIEGDFATVLLPLLTFPHIPPNATKPYDAYFGGWGTGYDPDPFSLFHSSQCTTEAQPELNNYICFKNAEADKLIEDGLKENDQAKRAAIYQKFEQIMFDQQPYLFAWADLAHEALSKNLISTAGELKLDSPQWHWQLESLKLQN
ncbi:MAG: ABC transporter substrate-binding protein, partial [Candidatus Dormibacteraeota bacterium]|nr:ABC transporter substrate-binding protein [Candidatus Dormibacteraeota bacterium]